MAKRKASKNAGKGGPPVESAPERMRKLRLLIDGALADWLQTKNDIITGKLIERLLVSVTAGRLFAVWTGQMFPMSYAVSSPICAVIKTSNEDKLCGLIDDETYRAAKRTKDSMIAWIK